MSVNMNIMNNYQQNTTTLPHTAGVTRQQHQQQEQQLQNTLYTTSATSATATTTVASNITSETTSVDAISSFDYHTQQQQQQQQQKAQLLLSSFFKNNNNISTVKSSQSMPPPPLPPSISSSSTASSTSTSVSSSTSQQPQQPLISNSLAIRQEIQRFESVHPSIYAIYDLIDLLPTSDAQIAQQIRDHVVCIEDSFVNSQEWTISRAVPDLRLGIVGSLNSGKSALVHRYLTGSYMQEESPEGGRFKKEVFIDGQSYLLLVRDEGGAPEMQFAAWVDAVIFVFSLENETSFNTVYNFYTKLAHFRNGHELPIILVGTQDAINENNPRVIDDARARKLANELRRCAYYETCATYGLNVARVFQDACQRILQRLPVAPTLPSRPTTPQGTRLSITPYSSYKMTNNRNSSGNNMSTASTNGVLPPAYRQNVHSTSSLYMPPPAAAVTGTSTTTNTASASATPSRTLNDFVHNELNNNNNNNNNSSSSSSISNNMNNNQKMWAQPQHQTKLQQQSQQQQSQLLQRRELFPLVNNNDNNNISTMGKYKTVQQQPQQQHQQNMGIDSEKGQLLVSVSGTQQKLGCHVMDNNLTSYSLVPLREAKENSILGLNSASVQKELPTPTSTPTTSRKSRRRSNLFIPSSSKKSEKEAKNNELGSGRSIPIKQGYLYKRSSKSLNKEWKKKYVTLCDDGRLTYHPSLHDYMDDVHGKEIPLQYVTVKVPGQKPRGSKSIITNSVLTTSLFTNVLHTAFDTLRDPVKSNSSQQTSGDDEGIALSNSNSQTFIALDNQQQQQQQLQQNQQQLNIKKRHRRVKSSGVKSNDIDDSDGYEFFIVSLDSKQWHFEAANSEERDGWVAAIEQEIFKSLQGIESAKMKPATTSELAAMVAIRTRVPGNTNCVDCDAPNPEWASLNLGVLLCIECSGIHRNLGSHISKVRSLGLDDWPAGHLSVMLAIGNKLANSVWEANKGGRTKPQAHASRDEKEAWARSKYDVKEFLALPQNGSTTTTTTAAATASANGQQLIEAVIKSDMKSIISILAIVNSDVVNSTVSARDVRTPLLLACAMGNLAITQLLLWNGANIKHIDHEGRTCLSYARAAQSLATAKSLRASEGANSGNSSSSTNSSISSAASVLPQTQYSVEETTALVELLTSLGCPESAPLTASGTLPRRRDTLGTAYEKLMSGVI